MSEHHIKSVVSEGSLKSIKCQKEQNLIKMIDKIDTNERNNFTNENDVFNFVNLLFHQLYYGKDCEIKVDCLRFYWDLRRVGSKPDLMVSTDGMIKLFAEQNSIIT